MATAAGSTKMPAPIVAFTMLAVSSRVPITRTSCASGAALAVVSHSNLGVRNVRSQNQRGEHHLHLHTAVAHARNLQRKMVFEVPVIETFPDTDANVDAVRDFLIGLEGCSLSLANIGDFCRHRYTAAAQVFQR